MSLREFLERTTLFKGLSPPVVERLVGAAVTYGVARGSTIWRVGEPPQVLSFVKSGLVKLTRPAPRGRTSLCGLFGAPTVLGELVLVKGVPYQNTAAAATANVTLVSIPRDVVLGCMRSEPELALNLFCAFEDKFKALHDKIDVLSAGSVEARLATLLLKLYDQFGDELMDGTLRIGLPLSRQELADIVSTSFETAIRVLSRWEREGIVLTDGDGFTIGDRALLQTLSGDWGAPERAPASLATATALSPR